MEKEITFGSGLRLTPYSDVSPDGEMSVCHNLEPYGGGLRQSVLEGRELLLDTTAFAALPVMKHIHATGEYTHLVFVIATDNSGAVHRIGWFADDGSFPQMSYIRARGTYEGHEYQDDPIDVSGLTSITSVGNVLVVTAAREVYYALWRGSDYEWLGALPDIDVTWSLDGDFKQIGPTDLGVDTWKDVTGGTTSELWYNRAAVAMRAFEQKYCEGENRYVHPFLVRAAYRLADGTWTKPTAPVLLCPNVNMPLLGLKYDETSEGALIYMNKIFGFAAKLKGTFGSDSLPPEWGDVISGIDIFVSEPLDPWDYTYRKGEAGVTADTSGRVNGAVRTDCLVTVRGDTYTGRGEADVLDYLIGQLGISASSTQDLSIKYGLRTKSRDVYAGLLDTGAFYRVMTLTSQQIANAAGRAIEIERRKGVYANIMQQERLEAAEDSCDRFGAEVSYVYNGRLTLGDITRRVMCGETLSRCVASLTGNSSHTYKCYWERNENGQTHYVYAGEVNDIYRKLYYVYTPDSYAKRLWFIDRDFIDPERSSYGSFELEHHAFLGGMYYCRVPFEDDGTGLITVQGAKDVTPAEEVTRVSRNDLRTSGANNPFVFNEEGWNRVGNGRVIALASITKPLSEGQMGQFPLMALCTDGNYALEVITSGSMAGLYGNVTAMQRDVCVNRESVTQTDHAILFVSNRGVMVADGNEIRCISEELNGPHPWLPPGMDDVYEAAGRKLRDYFEGCKIVWDYTNQRALFCKEGEELVFQWKDGIWSSQTSGEALVAVQNVYPYSYIENARGYIYVLDDDYNFTDTFHEGKLVTRPIKMETLQLKKLNEISLQGCFRGAQKMSVYGSNDQVNWSHIGTTTRRRVPHIVGRWFKYWRFVIETHLREDEWLTGLRLRYDVRDERRVR